MSGTQDKNNNRTLDQKRAIHALENIKEIQDKNDGYYISYVSALPATIVMNGLGQALLTLLAKDKGSSKDSHRLLHDHVASWLAKQIEKINGDPKEVIGNLMKNDQKTYLIAQAEAMAYLNWLKQFAHAYLKEKEGQDD